jgi:protein-disulfide isomerase
MHRGSRSRIAVLALAVLAIAGVASPGAAQTQPASKSDVAELKTEVERLRREVDGIRGDLRAIRDLLLQRQSRPTGPTAPPPPATVSAAGSAMLGRPDAPVVLVEFSDYQCPFCKRFSETTLALLKKEFVESGKVRYIFRDFPLDQIHPDARKAAEAARCAGDQAKYWEMHDVLFQNQRALRPEHLKGYAEQLGLDTSAFAACLDSAKHAAQVQKDFDDGVKAGVRSTPSFIVGRPRADGTIEGVMITGARPIADFRREVERLLAAN